MPHQPRPSFQSPRFAQPATFMRLPHVDDPARNRGRLPLIGECDGLVNHHAQVVARTTAIAIHDQFHGVLRLRHGRRLGFRFVPEHPERRHG